MINLRAKATQKLGASFVAEADRISRILGFPTVFLLGVIDSESGMNPSINNRGTNADGSVDWGLIQMNDKWVLPKYGLTGAQFASFSPLKQLTYIYDFYKTMAGKVRRFGDLYGYNLAPAYALANSQNADFLAFKRKVEQAFTTKTGLSPIASNIRENRSTTTTKQDNSPLILLSLLLLL